MVLDGGVSVLIPPQHYIVNDYCGDPKYYALAMDEMDVGDGTILGDAAMKSYEVVHDRQAMRVGFAPVSGCPTGA